VPVVELVSPQSEGQQYQEEQETSATGKSKAALRGEAKEAEAGGGEEVQAVLTYVVTSLNEELLTELLEGFHAPIVRTEEEEEDEYDDDDYGLIDDDDADYDNVHESEESEEEPEEESEEGG
jgi:hypothetical protein